MQLNSRIIILVQAPGSSDIYVTFFSNNIFVQCYAYMLFKQLIGEIEIDHHLRFEILYF